MSFRQQDPIILAHGVARFDAVTNMVLDIDNDASDDNLHYFRGIRTMLMKHGFTVFHGAGVPWAAPLKERSAALKKTIQERLSAPGVEKVNIIAHSMGGLDVRHMMFNDRDDGRIHQRIASVTTISTPHSGSPFADCLVDKLPGLVEIGRTLGLDLAGLNDLTVAACNVFNNDPKVTEFEQSIAAAMQFRTCAGSTSFLAALNILKISHAIIQQQEGENDGLVSVLSAKWRGRPHHAILPQTDHLNELAWWDLAQIFTESEKTLRQRLHDFYLGLTQ